MANSERPGRYEFSEFTLDINRGVLFLKGEEVSLRPKSFAVLQYLVANQGRLVSRDELIEAVWGHLHVTDSSLSQCLRDIRQALDDKELKLIHTIPRRGYRFEPVEVEPVSSPAVDLPASNSRLVRWAVIGCFAILVGVALLYFTVRDEGDVAGDANLEMTSASQPSIAVLPLLDLSPEGDLGYLADGLAEEILNRLAQSEDLRVIARTSSFAFRGQDVALSSIAEALDVNLVLEGSVRRSGDLVRVSATLVDTQGHAQLWSESYDYPLADLFALQTQVAQDVFYALNSELEETPQEIEAGPGAAAYEAYLIGAHFLNRGDFESLERARENLELAVRLEPDFAPAWSKLSDCYRRLAYRSPENSEMLFADYLGAVQKALELDPTLPEASYLSALMFRFQARDDDFLKVIAEGLESGNSDPNFLSLAMGDASDYEQFNAAIKFGEQAQQLDPLSAIGLNNLGYAYIGAGRLEDALLQFERLSAVHPGLDSGKVGKTIVLLLLGRKAEAVEVAASISSESALRNRLLAFAHWNMGEQARALELMGELVPQDERQSQISQVEWYAFTGQFEEALAVMAVIQEQFPGSCNGPNTHACGKLADMWGSPFMAPLRKLPRARSWVDTIFPGHTRRQELRKALYQRWE